MGGTEEGVYMFNLNHLVELVLRDSKLQEDQIISILTDAITTQKEEKQIFLDLYTFAYGFNITEEVAETIVSELPAGERFTIQDAQEYEEKLCATTEEISAAEFYLVMNSMYSQYARTMCKYNIADFTVYADLAVDWFSDHNSDINKTFNFFFMQ